MKARLREMVLREEAATPRPKVLVSGCFDLLHSGHVEFFREAAEHGDLYVRIGSDKNIKMLERGSESQHHTCT